MQGEHNILANGMGTGIGWLLAGTNTQAQWVMKGRREFGCLQQGQGRGQQQQQHGRGLGNWDRCNANNGGQGYGQGCYGGCGHY